MRDASTFYIPFLFYGRYGTTGMGRPVFGVGEERDVRKRLIRFALVALFGALVGALAVAPVAAAGLIARVAGGGILFDGNGFYPGELVQINGIRYDGSTLPYGPATANEAGAITGVVPYADTALYQIDARGYTSGMHAVSNITGALPYPVVPPGYPYVTQTFPEYSIGIPGTLPVNGGYANTGYPFTGAPYGGPYPGPGFNYPVPPGGVILYPYPNGAFGVAGAPTLAPAFPSASVGAPVPFSGAGWAPGATVTIWLTAPEGANSASASVTTGNDGSLTGSVAFTTPGLWRVSAQAPGMNSPVIATVQVGQ